MRRFELAGEPRRFWEVTLHGNRVQMRWGEVGTPGRAFDRAFASESEAEVFAERQVIAQQERGYVEIATTSRAATAPEIMVERHQRFEWPSKRFVEITQEGHKVTVRGGKLADGRDLPDRLALDVRHYPTPAEATQAFHARCATERANGGAAVEPEPTHALHHEAVLEAQCDAAPDDPAPWIVYADWLIAHGDARGEIAALHRGGNADAANRVLAAHLYELCGTDTARLAFEFRHGFAVHCTVQVDLADADELLEDATRALLASPMGRFLESLRFGLAAPSTENDWGPTLHAVATSPRAARIRALRFDAYTRNESELSWTPFGDFSSAWPHLPALEHLHIKSGAGGTLGTLDLPNLRTFIRESGGLAHAELDAIVAARWPRLEHLEIWFGSSDYGAEGELSSIRAILGGEALPALRHLGIVNCEFVDAVIPELARAPILPRLTSLDLSRGVMARTATATLVANAAAFRHLAKIDVDANLLLPDEIAQLRAALPNLHVGTQRERDYNDDDDEELDRFVAVSE